MQFDHEMKHSMKLKSLYYLYEKGYTQTEIAKRLNISRVTLSKWLDEAREEGLVKIEIVDTKNQLPLFQLEEEMKELFSLQDVKIINSGNMDDRGVMFELATSAIPYFEQLIHSDMRIGVTWGRTLNTMISKLRTNFEVKNLSVYTLLGSVSSSATFQPNILAQNLLSRYSGTLKIISAPFLCPTEQLCRDFKQIPEIDNILREVKNLDLTLVGIGEAPQEHMAMLNDYPFDSAIIEDLINNGAVGDICGNFFDIDGKPCNSIIKNRVLSIDIQDLPQHKLVVGIAGGSNKVRSILGALHGSYLDILITDSQTASAVIAMEKASRG